MGAGAAHPDRSLRGQQKPAFLGDRTSDANGCPDMVPATPFVSLPFLPLSLLLSPPLPSLSRFHRLPNYSLLSVTDTIKVVCRGPCHKWHLRSSPNGEWPLKRRAGANSLPWGRCSSGRKARARTGCIPLRPTPREALGDVIADPAPGCGAGAQGLPGLLSTPPAEAGRAELCP